MSNTGRKKTVKNESSKRSNDARRTDLGGHGAKKVIRIRKNSSQKTRDQHELRQESIGEASSTPSLGQDRSRWDQLLQDKGLRIMVPIIIAAIIIGIIV